MDTAAAGAPPRYAARRTLHTGADLRTYKQCRRLGNPFATDGHAHRRALMTKLIESVQPRRPRRADRAAQLGRTLSKRAGDVLAYFDRPSTSNGPTEAINGRLEYLCGSALGHHGVVGGGADLAHRPDHRVAGQGAVHPP